MMDFFDAELSNFMIKIIFSVLFATIIGLERELTGHKDSIKVNILVALGACIFASYESLMHIEDNRISANIVTGVGFLCSGVIFKNGLNVNGLSTAATLWCSAGLGILTSRGFFLEGFLISLFLFCLNFLLSKTVTRIKPLKSFDDTRKNILYTYNIVCLKTSSKNVKDNIIESIFHIDEMDLEELVTKNITEDKVRIVATVKIDMADSKKVESLLKKVDPIDGVLSSGWSKLDS